MMEIEDWLESGSANNYQMLPSQISQNILLIQQIIFYAIQIEDYSLQQQMDDAISFLSKTEVDTMYLHEAMAEQDRDSLKLAIAKEIVDHC